jgi:hypothetical protein
MRVQRILGAGSKARPDWHLWRLVLRSEFPRPGSLGVGAVQTELDLDPRDPSISTRIHIRLRSRVESGLGFWLCQEHLIRGHGRNRNKLRYAAILISAVSRLARKRPSFTLALEIAQVSIWQANCLATPTDIEFPAGRTTDLESVETLVAHLISPIRFRRSGFIQQ